MTYREAVFLITDSLRQFSDDSVWESEHIIKFLHKYRALLVKQRYLDRKKEIPRAFYQRLNVTFDTSYYRGDIYQSENIIPDSIDNQLINTYTYVSPNGINSLNFNFITPQRFKVVGHNKWLKNEVYVCIDLDGYMYVKSPNIDALNIQAVAIDSGGQTYLTQDEGAEYQLVFDQLTDSYLVYDTILDNPIDADRFNGVNTLDILDLDFPCDESLFQTIVELTIKEMSVLNGLPRDLNNNANDDTGLIQNTKKD